MEARVLDRFAWRLTAEDLLRRLRAREGSAEAAEVRRLVGEAEAIGRPRALAGVAYVDERGGDYVVIDGIRFASRVLVVNLQQTHRVFPFVATCGGELEEWAAGLDDILHRFWSEAIREAAMRTAVDALVAHLDESYQPGELSRMSPGSLADWPLQEQMPLFRLLGDPAAAIGVHLTSSLLMVPSKTVSGIRFGGASGFESCMLCPREICPGRRAAYDPELYARRYRTAPAAGAG